MEIAKRELRVFQGAIRFPRLGLRGVLKALPSDKVANTSRHPAISATVEDGANFPFFLGIHDDRRWRLRMLSWIRSARRRLKERDVKHVVDGLQTEGKSKASGVS